MKSAAPTGSRIIGSMEDESPANLRLRQFSLSRLFAAVAVAAIVAAAARVDRVFGLWVAVTAICAFALLRIAARYRWSDAACSLCLILFLTWLFFSVCFTAASP